MRIDFVTLFPETVRSAFAESILGRAQRSGLIEIRTANPRDFCYDRHQKVDDSPFGGEPGMLIRAEPVDLALKSLQPCEGAAVILTAPTGALFAQPHARSLTKAKHVVFLCGHYEGFDHRVELKLATHVFSIGDYVLTNGELPALVMADAIARLVLGVLGDPASLGADSHADGLLSAPNYTRPEEWEGLSVPEVLRSGDHKAIDRWRRREALLGTKQMRPDLLARAKLSKSDLTLLWPPKPEP